MKSVREPHLGADYLGNDMCRFCVWAPLVKKIEVRLVNSQDRVVPLTAGPRGYHQTVVEGVPPGVLYFFRLDGAKERPDPASRSQPGGVHGPSQVVDPAFAWEDEYWPGVLLQDYLLYELHVGTFTSEGTFEAIIPQLDGLKDLGITALELMPLAQFPGGRNWGYDGVFPFAVQHSYGGLEGLQKLVNACHRKEMAVVLDVVYNHLGPEGNYLGDYGPYFTLAYQTPWGPALNFDRPDSEEVRRFFLENALYWLEQCHVDALRLDAIHAIKDFSARPFLVELAELTKAIAAKRNRPFYLIAESNLNDVRVLQSQEMGGLGMDGQWSDDFHHAVHTLLTGEKNGYYEDFGKIEHLVRAWRTGFAYTGQYSSYRRRRHGNIPAQQPPWKFVVSIQNHDQVGNRMLGERLSGLVSFDALKVAAGAMILSPFLPLLFMGEEYGETTPFQYFTSHGDAALIEAVRQGRREEFAGFRWQGDVPDPQDEATFARCRLSWDLPGQKDPGVLRDFYRQLILLRKTVPPLSFLSKDHQEVVGFEKPKVLFVRRWTDGGEQILLLLHFGADRAELTLPVPPGRWRKILDSAESRWWGDGRTLPASLDSDGGVILRTGPQAMALFRREMVS